MLKLSVHALLDALHTLATINTLAGNDPEWAYRDDERRRFVIQNIDNLLSQLEILELRLSIKKAQSIRISLREENVAVENLKTLSLWISQQFGELQERIVHELEDRTIFYVDAPHAELLTHEEPPFGNDVSDKFPESTTDLAEAAKCLGMSRNTAAVFHLMRAMEDAVKCLGKKLGVTVIDKNNRELEWGKILANLNAPIEAMPKGAGRDNWSECVTLLYHVKQTWRNGTMHPKQTYDEVEARSAYQAVKSFMTHLASLV